MVDKFQSNFVPEGDTNDLILQMRTWEQHDVGRLPSFGGDVTRALASIKAPLLYMPSETDLYFLLEDARYKASFIPHVILKPIPLLWGHPAGAAADPADGRFLNTIVAAFWQLFPAAMMPAGDLHGARRASFAPLQRLFPQGFNQAA